MKFQNLLNKILILEELTKDQKELADQFANKRSKDMNFGPVFKQQRTYFPLKYTSLEELVIPENIKQAVDQAGFYITDYRSGIAIKKNDKKDLRQIKVGKILNRLNKPELIKQFNERLGTSRKSIQKLLLCITHNPYDIAGMSTGRNWTSCMNLDGGVYHATVLHGIQYGDLCAYLIKQSDKNIEQPLARVAIKRLVDQSQTSFIFISQQVIYGDVQLATELKINTQINEILNRSNKETSKLQSNVFHIKDTVFKNEYDEKATVYSDSGLGDMDHLFLNKDIKNLTSREFYYMNINQLKELTKKQLQYLCNKFEPNWDRICQLPNLDEEFMQKYLKYPDFMQDILFYQKLSESFFQKHFNELDHDIISTYQPLSLEFIKKHENNLNLHKIIRRNKYTSINQLLKLLEIFPDYQQEIFQTLSYKNNLTPQILKKYEDKLNWDHISANCNLSEDLIEKFKDKIDWTVISQYQKLSENFIRKYQDKVVWPQISQFQNLSEQFIEEFQDKINWFSISKKPLSEAFIEKFKDKVYWDNIAYRQNLSEKFIKKYRDKLNNYYLLQNKRLPISIYRKIKNHEI